jgi:hypothetical protein
VRQPRPAARTTAPPAPRTTAASQRRARQPAGADTHPYRVTDSAIGMNTVASRIIETPIAWSTRERVR